MIAQSVIVGKNEAVTLKVKIEVDNKGNAGSAGLLARITNRYFEQLLEWFNANQIVAAEYCRVTKPDPKTLKKSV